jgi:hypothetical protein
MQTFVEKFGSSIRLGLALVVATSSALAVETTVGGVSIKLPPPAGFC